MDIGYVWDEDKYRMVKKKHQVSFTEVVAAFEDPNAIEFRSRSTKEERWILVGKTNEGRILSIVFTEEDLPIFRIVTAYEAKGEHLREYKK